MGRASGTRHDGPNGIEIPDGCDREVCARAGGALRALFVGRLTNWKGVETLLLAVEKAPRVTATIVGDGPGILHPVELGATARCHRACPVHGALTPTLVGTEMRAAHVLVLTSLYEGLSHTMLEAMAVGLPCIASRRGGNEEVIHDGMEGLLIDPQDVSALTCVLGRLQADEPMRAAMARAARERAWAFPLSRTVERVAEILRSA